jgi:hypothetical protein
MPQVFDLEFDQVRLERHDAAAGRQVAVLLPSQSLMWT